MKIEYDRVSDALYIQFRQVNAEDNLDIEDGVTVDLDTVDLDTVDLDKEGHIVGIEILDASDRFGIEALVNVSIENMPLHQVKS